MTQMLPIGNIQLPWQAPRIAVLEMHGAIGMQVRGAEMVRTIKALTDDARIRAVVIDIDSPGGSAPVSDAIYRAVRKLSARKPTIAFVLNGALSGGYLIASATRKIVALPTSMVGSIGVIFMRPVVQELMDRVGVKMVMTHEGKLKGMFQPWHEPTAEEQVKVQALTNGVLQLVRGGGGKGTGDARGDRARLRHGRVLLGETGQGDRPRRRAGRPGHGAGHGERAEQDAAPPAVRAPAPPAA